MRITRSRTSGFVRTVWLARMTPALSTVRTSGFKSPGFGSSSFFSDFGRFIQNVRVIIVVTIMKMMRTTSTTSTSGVTLMTGAGRCFLSLEGELIPMTLPAAFLVVHLEQDPAKADFGDEREDLPHPFVRRLMVHLEHERPLRVLSMELRHLGLQVCGFDLLLVEHDRAVHADRELEGIHFLGLLIRGD